MTVSDVQLFSMRGSLANGTYPLITGDEVPVRTVQNVLHKKGIQTSVDVPYFDGIEGCNVAKVDGYYYWITVWKERTTDAKQYTLQLDFMGPSLFMAGATIRGDWRKLPTNNNPYLKDAVTNDIMMIRRSFQLDEITCADVEVDPFYETHTFWLQVTGFNASGKIEQYGCFVPYFEETESFHATYYGNRIKAFNDGSNDIYYPNVDDIISDLTACCGLLAENVIDISVSRRCPYAQYVNGNYIKAISSLYDPTPQGTNTLVMYDTWNVTGSDQNTELVAFSLSDAERAVGQICIKDWNGNNIMEIPTMHSDEVFVYFQDVSDITGIYLKIQCNDQVMMIPEGHIPYQGSNWETYKAYQMDTDRLIMENAISNAKENRETQAISGTLNAIMGGVSTGVMTGILGGNVAGAAVGIGSSLIGTAVNQWELNRAFDLEKRNAEFNNIISRRQAIMQPETSYNLGYGLIYGYQNIEIPLRVCVMMPNNLNDSKYEAWTSIHGFPAEGYQVVTAQDGYYQGTLTEDNDKSGMYWDRCVESFMNGIRYVYSD